MFVEQQAGIIQLGTLDEEIDFRLNNQGTTTTVMRLSSAGQVGVMKTNPTAVLDIAGTLSADGIVTANDTTDATNIGSGSLVVKGGLGVAKKLFVGNDTTITGNLVANNITPSTNNIHNLGSTNNQYGNVYANTFVGNDRSKLKRNNTKHNY